jgi:anti-anti-sigma regulatory factor
MLRITEQRDEHSLTFKLAGRLAGEWTPELQRCWQQAVAAHPHSAVTLDLAEVTFVDDAGKQLLTAMAAARVELIAADIQMRALVEQIAQRLAGHKNQSAFTD